MHVTKQTKEECDDEIDLIHETINKDQAEYDKQLLTLSSAFLVVSLGFIKDVVPLASAVHTWLLYTAYILLVLCIGLVLFSYQYSIHGHCKAKEYWEKIRDGEEAKFPFSHATQIAIMNRISGVIFAVGALLLSLFVITNIHHQIKLPTKNAEGSQRASMNTSSNDPEKRGSNIKIPARPASQQPASSTNSNQSNTGQGTTKTDK
jgi:hypothetical protein